MGIKTEQANGQGKLLDSYKSSVLTPCIGTEFRDMDLKEIVNAPNSDELIAELARLMAVRGVLFFRKQDTLDNETQKKLCLKLNEFGGCPLENGFYRHSLYAMQGEDPEMGKVDPDRLFKMYTPKQGNLPRQSHRTEWHTDSAFEANAPSYTVLKMTELPSAGGDTLWASGYELYDRLSVPFKRLYDSLTATYKSPHLAKAAADNPKGSDAGPRGAPANTGFEFESHHPVVRTHPITGWKSVFACGTNCVGVDNVTQQESDYIMNKNITMIMENHDMVCRYKWENENDVAVWDNRCTFHTTTNDHFGLGTRIGWRCMTMGEKPYLDPNSPSRKEATGGYPYELKSSA